MMKVDSSDWLVAVGTWLRRAAHPDEPWTARKALLRRIEHELEHLIQIQANVLPGEARLWQDGGR